MLRYYSWNIPKIERWGRMEATGDNQRKMSMILKDQPNYLMFSLTGRCETVRAPVKQKPYRCIDAEIMSWGIFSRVHQGAIKRGKRNGLSTEKGGIIWYDWSNMCSNIKIIAAAWTRSIFRLSVLCHLFGSCSTNTLKTVKQTQTGISLLGFRSEVSRSHRGMFISRKNGIDSYELFYFNSNLPAHEKWRQTYFSSAGFFLKQLIWGLEKKMSGWFD